MKSLCAILAILCVLAAGTKPNMISILADDVGQPGCGCTK